MKYLLNSMLNVRSYDILKVTQLTITTLRQKRPIEDNLLIKVNQISI